MKHVEKFRAYALYTISSMRFISLRTTCHLSYLYLKKTRQKKQRIYVFSVLRVTGENKLHDIVSGIREKKETRKYKTISLI